MQSTPLEKWLTAAVTSSTGTEENLRYQMCFDAFTVTEMWALNSRDVMTLLPVTATSNYNFYDYPWFQL